MGVDHGRIESATASAHSRVREQLAWLERLPGDFTTVLDVGAGLGVHSKWFLETGRRPVALDRYPTAFAYGAEIELICKDLDELDESRQFDAVFCSHVLEHFPDPAAAVRKMRSLIRPGGYLLVIVPPYEPVCVNYHWHTGWNCTQLALLLVALGFDCSEATFMQAGANVCGWGRKADVEETRFNLRSSLPLLPPGMARQFFERDGYDFLPGDLLFADPREAWPAPTAMHLGFDGLYASPEHTLDYQPGEWNSFEHHPNRPLDLSAGPTDVVIVVDGSEVAFRIAVGLGPDDDVWRESAERYLLAKPGLNVHRFSPSDFRPINGEVDFQAVRHLSLGGTATAASRLRFRCRLPDGTWL
jgi:SAM-dependent methyltransferase